MQKSPEVVLRTGSQDRMKFSNTHSGISTSRRLKRAAAFRLRTPFGAANVVAQDDCLADFRRALRAVEAVERRWRRTQAERVFRCN